ncbi:MAG: hypothetical protein QGI68_16985, partial [Pseudomonadales bacterium]|nr:hypothetical protein [Pseudomonadales bacterium]
MRKSDGTNTRLNDPVETAAIKKVFGERACRIPISSNKSMVDHPTCAAGIVEAIAAVRTIQNGIIPPTINYETPDPECDLDYVPNRAREQEVKTPGAESAGLEGRVALVTGASRGLGKAIALKLATAKRKSSTKKMPPP